MPSLYSYATVDEVAAHLRTYVLQCQKAAFARHDKFKVAVSGGSLPATLSKALLAPDNGTKDDKPEFSKWEIFFADERAVPLDHEDSNYCLLKKDLLDEIPPSSGTPTVHPIDVKYLDDTQELADQYQETLMNSFASKDSVKLPVFDLLLLGCGPDGHTCSLFPGHDLLRETDAWVAPIEDSPKPPPRRITLSLPVVTHGVKIAFVATGGGKKDILKKILEAEEGRNLPCGLVNAGGGEKVSWFTDHAATEDEPNLGVLFVNQYSHSAPPTHSAVCLGLGEPSTAHLEVRVTPSPLIIHPSSQILKEWVLGSKMPLGLKTVSTALDGAVAILKFNRPKNANALGATMLPDLLAAFKWAMKEPKVKVAVLSGEGRFYTTGLDLVGVPKEGTVMPDQSIACLKELHETLVNAEKPLLAAVNGPAVGWGVTSMALFDLVYSVPDAFFFTPFVKLGLCAEACASVSFARIMGRQKATALILAGERMTSQELESAGLITKILPKENFLPQVMEIAHRMASQPFESLKFNKKLIMDGYREELLAANERECEGLRQLGNTKESRDAISAFEQESKDRKKNSSKL